MDILRGYLKVRVELVFQRFAIVVGIRDGCTVHRG